MSKLLLSLTALFLCVLTGRSQGSPDRYQPGFKVLRIMDRSRNYKPGTDTADSLHYRTIDVDIWYPAEVAATDTPLNFRDYLDQFAYRANYYSGSHIGDGLQDTLAKVFCQGWQCSTPDKLSHLKTNSYNNARQAPGKFPVIVYMASYGNIGYENYMLFESLVKDGFVIVSISSIGRYPGDMTMKNEDMLEQVYDARAAVKYLQGSPGLDFSKTAVLGYSWGGLSGVMFSALLSNVKCLISFEGSEYHHYNEDKGEDSDFNGIKNSAAFKNLSVSMPYLRFESSPTNTDSKTDSVYNFTQKLSPRHFILKVGGASHEDFCCLGVAVRASGNCPEPGRYTIISALTVSFLEDQLKGTNSFPATLNKFTDNGIRIVKK